MPTGEAAIPETATTPPEAGKSGPAPDGAAPVPRRGFRPVAFAKATIKNAPWIVIAVVLHVVAILVLSIIYVKTHKPESDVKPTTIGVGKSNPDDVPEPDVAPEPIIDRNAIPKPQNRDAELIDAETADALAADTPTERGLEDLSKDVGDPADAAPSLPSGGTSLGVGASGGHFGTGKPSAFVSRAGAGKGDGTGRLPTGETEKTDRAVRLGMIWLVRHQQPDGSWSNAKLKDVCEPKGACSAEFKGEETTAQYDEGLTGLALLAFLGNGKDHTAKQTVVDTVRAKRTRLGEVVKNGLQWLRTRQASHPDGRFSDDGHIYNEALATLAMCEAYGLSGHQAWKEPAQKGLDFLVAAQRLNPSGTGLWGWRYESRTWIEGPEGKAAFPDEKEWRTKQHESDISATAWVVMALKSGELAGLTVPEAAMHGAMDFVNYVTVKDGRVAYMDPLQVGRKIAGDGDQYDFHIATLGALGMCVRTFAEKNIDDPSLELGAKQLVADLPDVSKNKLSVDYYYWYYGTLALNQFDGPASPKRSGKYWNAWNKALTETLLPTQDEAKTCAGGGWTIPDRWSHAGGPIYRTATNVLTLEVYYRYENAFAAGALKKRDIKTETPK